LFETLAAEKKDESEPAFGNNIKDAVSQDLSAESKNSVVFGQEEYNGVKSPQNNSEPHDLSIGGGGVRSNAFSGCGEDKDQIVDNRDEEDASQEPESQGSTIGFSNSSGKSSQNHKNIKNHKSDLIVKSYTGHTSKVEKKKRCGDKPVKVTGVLEDLSILNKNVSLACTKPRRLMLA